MEIPQHIKDSVKTTVGYSEAADKESFMIGASVGLGRAERFYAPIIETLKEQLNSRTADFERVDTDMRTIANLIQQYTFKED